MKPGDWVYTPRFCSCKIEEVLTKDEACEQGYNEPTHYNGPDYMVLGKHTGPNQMIFAAVKRY